MAEKRADEVQISTLAELFPVFERLEGGQSVLLIQNAEEVFMSRTTRPRMKAAQRPLTLPSPPVVERVPASGLEQPTARKEGPTRGNPAGSKSQCAIGESWQFRATLGTTNDPLTLPSPPLGERAPARRVRGVRGNFTGEARPTDLPPREVSLGVRTSGTTDVPKIVWHRWTDLRSDACNSESVRGWKWASPYRADSYAGVQVALQAWRSGGNCLNLSRDLSDAWRSLQQHRPEALCCTPTFLHLLLLSETATEPASGWAPRQITLGGEPLREQVGRLARERFPSTRFTVVYASAELGLIARTHRVDGWFETRDLMARSEGWQVIEGVLELRRADSWQSSQDLVEAKGNLFRVVGRAGSVANVGGTKVQLAEVESAAEEVPGVLSARAWAENNPITGQTVALRFSVVPGREPAAVRSELESHLRGCLRKEAWPRRWELAEATLGPNAKKAVE